MTCKESFSSRGYNRRVDAKENALKGSKRDKNDKCQMGRLFSSNCLIEGLNYLAYNSKRLDFILKSAKNGFGTLDSHS